MKPEKIKIIFIENNKEIEVEASVGLSVLEVAHENNIDLEGACEGSLACATCHVILEEKIYNVDATKWYIDPRFTDCVHLQSFAS